MVTLIKIIGIIIALMGVILTLSPKALLVVVGFFKRGRRFYWVGMLRLLFGVILLLGASQCRLVGVVVTIGILFLVAGVGIFAIGLEKLRSIVDWWNRRSLASLRLMGLLVLAFGVLLIYSA